jgi:hypothetical protein
MCLIYVYISKLDFEEVLWYMEIVTWLISYLRSYSTQTFPDLSNNYVPEDSSQVKIEYRPTYVCINKYVSLKSGLHQTGTWSAAAWPPNRLCYRSAIFFRHLRLIHFHPRKEKFGARYKKYYYFSFLLYKSGTVCMYTFFLNIFLSGQILSSGSTKRVFKLFSIVDFKMHTCYYSYMINVT